MNTLYVAELLLVVAAVAGMLWLRRASDQAWAAHRTTSTVRVDISLDFTGFNEALERAAASMQRFGRAMSPRRPCGCLECAEHDPDCPDHPLNRGWRTAMRYRSRCAARRWHERRRRRLVDLADRHDWSALVGRWWR